MKPYQIAMALALVGSAGLVLFGDNAPVSGIAEPVARSTAAGVPATAPASRVAAQQGKPQTDSTILRLTPRVELVGDADDATFASGEGIFLGHNWNPPPPPPPPPSNAPPPPPMAPPIPFLYLGKAAADGAWEVYLSQGDKTYTVRNNTVIDGVYRIEKIAPPLMTVTYLPLKQQQQMNIGVLD
jgi:hypothetical protein